MKSLHFALLATSLSLLLSSTFSAQASLSGDEHWDNQFGPPGVNGNAYGVAVIGNNVYVGGVAPSAAGNTKANLIAGFDGTNWFQLNAGLLDNVGVIEVAADGNNLYASGIFTNADDPSAIDTARWDGTNWSGIGIQGLCYAIKRNGGNLYFAGNFPTAGGIPATNIARWDGTNWFPVGSGSGVSGCSGSLCSPTIGALAFQGSNVYIGGNFTSAGGVSASYVAYFDGNNWNAMGNILNGPVVALAFYGPYLYAGGNFTNAAFSITNIARWDGTFWSAVPGGGANSTVEDFATDGTDLYVGGWFTSIGGIVATNIASFDGNNWSPLGSGLHGFQGAPGQVNKINWSSNQLYVAGGFERAGDVGASGVARWDGASWNSLGGQTSHGMAPGVNVVDSLLFLTNSTFVSPGIYAGGAFTEAGDTVVNRLGYWDGSNWNPVGGGIAGTFGSGTVVRALAADSSYLYAGGNFSSAGGNPASGVAYWDGSNWNPLGSGVDATVNSATVDNFDYVYFAGIFTNSGAGYSRGFATWASGSWLSLGTLEAAIGGSGAGNSVVYDGGSKIYVGGSFITAGGVTASNIAYLDNTDFSWHPLGLGLNAKANTVAYGNGLLYAGGSFTKAGTLTVNHIAQWDGANWFALGSGITGSASAIVNSILVAGTNVYVTGNFTNAGGVIATNIAVWNGSSWSAMGSGLDIPRAGFAMAADGNDLYVGGNFYFAGDKPAQFIARWNSQSDFYPAANMRLTRAAWQTNRQFRFRVTGTSGQRFIIQGSTNLTSWTPLLTNSTMFFDFTDTNSANIPSRFYRSVLGP